MRTRTVASAPPVTLREWGQGRRLLFLHSMGPVSSGAIAGVFADPLVRAGFQVIAPDLPGYGDTPPLESDAYDLDRMAAWMWDVATDAGIERTTLVGHSLGGALACHMHVAAAARVEALVLVDSGHLDYADVLGDDLSLTLDDWVDRAGARRLTTPDAGGLANELGVDADDPMLDLLLVGMEYDDSGGLVSRVQPEAHGAAQYHLARARQSGTWPSIAEAGTPTLALLATEPEPARRQNEAAAPRFRAAVPQADVRMVEGATHSLVTDLRERFGEVVAEWHRASVPA